jgi:hypothetical protein
MLSWPTRLTVALVALLLCGCGAIPASSLSPLQSDPISTVTHGPFEPPPTCPAALLSGELVAQGDELAIREDPGGLVRPVRWSAGYGVHPEGGRLVLTDPFGTIKAREGDSVALGGGETLDGAWGVCDGEIEVSP